MITIEVFFVLAAVVVVIGLIVWRRDVKAGRVMRTTMRGPVTVMRERFASRASASGSPPAAAPAESPTPAPPAAPPRADAGEGSGG
jgi:hypothetical protein